MFDKIRTQRLNKYMPRKPSIKRVIDGKLTSVHHLYDYELEELAFKRTNSKYRNMVTIGKLVQNNSYVTPAIEEDLITFMLDNINTDYPEIMEKFPNITQRYIQNMRKKHDMPDIKKKSPLTFQKVLESDNQRYCKKCNTIKSLDEWYSHTKSSCISCEASRGVKKYETVMSKHLKSVEDFLNFKLSESKKRKNIKGLHTLKLEDLMFQYNKQSGKCYYSGRPLEIAIKNINSLSIDRIDSSLNYTSDNIVLCCSLCNFMKMSTTEEDFIEMCKDVSTFHSSS